MAFFDMFRKKKDPEVIDEEVEELDQEKEAKKQATRESYRTMQERKRLELESIRLEAEKRKQQLEEELEEIKHEREIRRLEREVRMNDLLDKLAPDEEEEIEGETPEAMLFSLLNKVMTKPSQSPAASPSEGSVPVQPVALSPERIKEIWDQMPPAHKAIAAKMTDEQLKEYLMNNVPNIDGRSIAYAISTVRSSA